MLRKTTVSTMRGKLNINGKQEDVEFVLANGELKIRVPKGTDTINWFHSVTLEVKEDTAND